MWNSWDSLFWMEKSSSYTKTQYGLEPFRTSRLCDPRTSKKYFSVYLIYAHSLPYAQQMVLRICNKSPAICKKQGPKKRQKLTKAQRGPFTETISPTKPQWKDLP
jgi:hypothetical protein